MLQRFYFWNFTFVTWCLIAYLSYKCYHHFFVLKFEYFAHYVYSFYLYFRPAVLLGMQLALWYLFYRKDSGGGKIFAFLVSIFLLFYTIIIPLLASDVSSWEFDKTYALIGLYLVLSHFAYSLLYKIENTYIRFY